MFKGGPIRKKLKKQRNMVDGKAWGTVIENSTKDKENTEDLNKMIVQFNNATA